MHPDLRAKTPICMYKYRHRCLQVRMYIYISFKTGEFIGAWGVRRPKAGNALQEACVHEVGNRGGFVWARCWNYIYSFFLFLGCRACAWTGTAPGVLGRGRPRVLGRPSHPPSSYHPKGGLIGYIYIYVQCTKCEVYIYIDTVPVEESCHEGLYIYV